MTTITILYPSGPAFDLDYYLKTHMSIVSEHWTPEGLESYEILKFEDGLPYQIQATLKFKSASAWDQALSGPTSKPVLGDIPNFTEAKPVLLKGHKQA